MPLRAELSRRVGSGELPPLEVGTPRRPFPTDRRAHALLAFPSEAFTPTAVETGFPVSSSHALRSYPKFRSS
jgi:hypothetical protein